MSAHPDAAALFDAAAAELRETAFRADIVVREIPSPAGLAPFALALAADVRPDDHGDSVYGTGRFVLLHDPDEPDAWGGAWRMVAFAQAREGIASLRALATDAPALDGALRSATDTIAAAWQLPPVSLERFHN